MVLGKCTGFVVTIMTAVNLIVSVYSSIQLGILGYSLPEHVLLVLK